MDRQFSGPSVSFSDSCIMETLFKDPR